MAFVHYYEWALNREWGSFEAKHHESILLLPHPPHLHMPPALQVKFAHCMVLEVNH